MKRFESHRSNNLPPHFFNLLLLYRSLSLTSSYLHSCNHHSSLNSVLSPPSLLFFCPLSAIFFRLKATITITYSLSLFSIWHIHFSVSPPLIMSVSLHVYSICPIIWFYSSPVWIKFLCLRMPPDLLNHPISA